MKKIVFKKITSEVFDNYEYWWKSLKLNSDGDYYLIFIDEVVYAAIGIKNKGLYAEVCIKQIKLFNLKYICQQINQFLCDYFSESPVRQYIISVFQNKILVYVLEKLGFEKSVYLRRDFKYKKYFQDVVVLRKEW